jgi:two-component system, cell cycle sensor histidine kinase and response regulator CckA
MKVLIVDGDPSSHTDIAEILTQRGCQLLEVNDAKAALRVAQKEKPEIAIVDILTPKLDRGEFVRQLRCDPTIARTPVIFYTDGYLEIASGPARDVDTLLTPMLLCEEAIRGKILPELNGTVASSDRGSINGHNGHNGHNGVERAQDVFTFACSGAGDRALIRPGDLIAETVDEVRKTFPNSIEITSGYSDDLWLIEGDRSELRRVLLNLLDSSRIAMPQGGSLLISALNFNVDQRYASMTLGAKLGRYVMLRVSDTGRGTPRPVSSTIFNPSAERKGIGSGTNLGLIRSHGGFMSVYSDLGRGTTFQIFLPARTAQGRPAVETKQFSEAAGSRLLVSA